MPNNQETNEQLNKEAFDANYQNLKIGDKIIIVHNEDQDLEDWYDEQDSCILTIESLEIESELLWTKEAPYAIQMACVTLANQDLN